MLNHPSYVENFDTVPGHELRAGMAQEVCITSMAWQGVLEPIRPLAAVASLTSPGPSTGSTEDGGLPVPSIWTPIEEAS